MLLILIILILIFGFGGNFYNGGAYRPYGFGLGGILLIVVVLLLLHVI
jgi:hypothetical protein